MCNEQEKRGRLAAPGGFTTHLRPELARGQIIIRHGHSVGVAIPVRFANVSAAARGAQALDIRLPQLTAT